MKEIVADPNLVAYCGLYCGACQKYLKGKCPGCRENEKATWCQVRACCMEHGYVTCADCTIMNDVADCKAYNNFMARLFGFIFRSDRPACIRLIQAHGVEAFAAEMAEKQIMSIRK
jgi:hypothetical protein